MGNFMDDDFSTRTRTKERTDTDSRVDDLFRDRPGADLPVLAAPPSGNGMSASPEFAMLLAMSRGVTRDPNLLMAEARRVGERLGERAIYSFPAGGKRIEGPTVHLMEALAQVWGHIHYGTRIDSVDGDRVTIMGVFADAITGVVTARPAVFTLAPVAGKFDAARWESMQLQAAISKAVRGVLQHGIPRWLTDCAYQSADDVRQGRLGLKEGETFADAVKVVVAFAQSKLGIGVEGLEVFVGSARSLWVVSDLFALREALRGVVQGTVSPDAFAVPTAAGTEAEQAPAQTGRAAAAAAVRATKAATKAKGEGAEPAAKPPKEPKPEPKPEPNVRTEKAPDEVPEGEPPMGALSLDPRPDDDQGEV